MLILTRRIGESLIIGEDGEIEVTLLGLKGNQARLGINASPHIPVHREEIYKKVQAEKQNAEEGNNKDDDKE